jgi:site-specific recombinase XerD
LVGSDRAAPTDDGLPVREPKLGLHETRQCIMLRVFLQTGICVSELCILTLEDASPRHP